MKSKMQKKHGELIHMKAIKIMISCNNTMLCEGITALLDKKGDVEVIGNITDGSQALQSLENHPADVFIIDPLLFSWEELPQVVQQLKTASPRTKLLLLIETEMSDSSLMHCIMRGIDGYVKRSAKLEQLVEAIRSVHAGNIWADRKLLEKFIRYPSVETSSLESRLSQLENPLTKREKDVISFLIRGLPNKRISHAMHISEKTVKTHLNNIFKKMNVSNRTEVVSMLIHCN